MIRRNSFGVGDTMWGLREICAVGGVGVGVSVGICLLLVDLWPMALDGRMGLGCEDVALPCGDGVGDRDGVRGFVPEGDVVRTGSCSDFVLVGLEISCFCGEPVEPVDAVERVGDGVGPLLLGPISVCNSFPAARPIDPPLLRGEFRPILPLMERGGLSPLILPVLVDLLCFTSSFRPNLDGALG